jgi:hypothetical protein
MDERTKRNPQLVHTVTLADVGKDYFVAGGHRYGAVDFAGYFQLQDVGKRIYKVPTDDGLDYIFQMENQEQLRRRTQGR